MTVVDDPAERTSVPRRHGTWRSPLTPGAVAAAAGGPAWPAVVGPETWWCASHTPTGTISLLRCVAPGEPARDVLGGDWKPSNSAIGYGGRPYLAVPGAPRHLVAFTHALDGRLYAGYVEPLSDAEPPAASGARAGVADPKPLTPTDDAESETCYADPILGPDGTELWCIREVVHGGASTDTSRDVVAVPLSGAAAEDPAAIRVVARSHDFLSGIRLSPDGTRLAWVGWDHPDMPWDNSSLMVARIVDGQAVDPVRVLGGDGVSVPQAEWAGADRLYAMADPDGWWNLHRISLEGDAVDAPGAITAAGATTATGATGAAGAAPKVRVACVLPMESECSHAIWRVGATSFAVTAAGVVLRYGVGDQRIGLWDPATGELTDVAGHAGEWTEFAVGLSGSADAVAVIAAGPGERANPVRIDLAAPTSPTVPTESTARTESTAPTVRVRRCIPPEDDGFEPWHARAERRRVLRPEGTPVHFVYYPPTSPDHHGPDEEPPPLIIDVHGGPTSWTGNSRSLTFSLFCSRGFAVASVDYGGSTGYGRAYRDLLRHTWGITDVEDCVTVARALAAEGLADPAHTAIRGGSAGGWTTLAALATTDVFCCGAVYYPISDPLTWFGEQTHDFESRYIESLVGLLPRDEEHFRRVSPLARAAGITAPFVMLQGLDDGICHPDQARRIVAAVEQARGPGLCRAFLQFPGEGHGFRRAGSIAASLEAELALFNAVMVL
jgi:hypothetical protein